MKQCSVPGCKNTFNLRMVPFTNETRWKAWLIRCPFLRKYSRKSLDNVRICELHFLDHHVINHRLTSDAIPSLNLPNKPLRNSLLEVFPNKSGKLNVTAINQIPSVSSQMDTVMIQTDFDCNKQSDPLKSDQVPCMSSQINRDNSEPDSNYKAFVAPTNERVPCESSTEPDFNMQCNSTEPDFIVQSVSTTTNLVHPCHTSTPVQNQTILEPTVAQMSPIPSNSMPSDISAIQSTPVHVKSHSRRHKTHVKSDLVPRVRLGENETPRKQKLRVGNQMLKMKLRNMTLRYNKLKSKSLSWSSKVKLFIKKYPLLSNFGKILLDSQLRLTGVKVKGLRYTDDEKVFAVSLYKLSPKCYRFLQKHGLQLPSKTTIGSMLSDIPLRPGINEFIFQHLADAAKNQNSMGLQCVLMFDEMAINKNLFFNFHTGVIEGFEDLGGGERTSNVADKALVFMLRGIFSSWKIPIAFYFARDGVKTLKLKNILKEIIVAIFKTGFILRCTVSDQGSANVAAINSLIADTREEILRNGNEDPNIFHYTIDKKYKLYHMYDVPHLLKCFRNNFQKKPLLIGTKRAEWKFIADLYASDGARGRARTTKLTDKHINPTSYDKMKVKLAAQVFSRTVSAALTMKMTAYEDLQIVHNYCVPGVNIDNGFFTAEVILFINDLFDSLNCSGHTRSELSNSLSLNSTHLEFWNNALKKLQSMKFDATDSRESNPISLRNFIHDIKTVKHLWADLIKISGVKFLSLKRLNQDPLEFFFSQIRGQGGASTHPDCHNFVSLFKTLLINNITTGQSLYANCTADNDKMLGTLSRLINRPKLDIQYNNFTSDIENFNFIENCIPSENVFQTQAVSYIAGAICKHLFPKLNCGDCQNCKSTLLSNEIEPFHSLIELKEYDSSNKKLYYPSNKLLSLVWHCIYIIEQTLPKICKVFIYTDLINKFECLDTSFLTCHEHKSDFLKAFWLFVIRMQVRQWCINFNRRMHNVDSRQKGMEMEDMLRTKVTKGASYRTSRRQSH